MVFKTFEDGLMTLVQIDVVIAALWEIVNNEKLVSLTLCLIEFLNKTGEK